MVEKSGVEKSRVEISSLYQLEGHFNPELFNPRLFNPGLFNNELSNPGFFNNPNPRLPWSPWYPAPSEVRLLAFLGVDFRYI